MTAPVFKYEVQLVTATWCNTCRTIDKTDMARIAASTYASLDILDYDTDLDDLDQLSITSLPTIRMRPVGTTEWQTLTSKDISAAEAYKEWKATMLSTLVAYGFSGTEF
jgi:hypothetical protein